MTTTYLIFSPALWISILPYFLSFQPSMRLWSSGPRSRHEAGAQKQVWRGELKLQWRKNSNQKTPQSKVFTGVDSTEAGLNTRTQKSPHGSRGELRNAEKQSRSHWEASVQAGLGGNHPTLELTCSCLPSNADYTNELSSCALSPATTQAAAPPSGKNEHKERPENPKRAGPSRSFSISPSKPFLKTLIITKMELRENQEKLVEKIVGSLCWYQSWSWLIRDK